MRSVLRDRLRGMAMATVQLTSRGTLAVFAAIEFCGRHTLAIGVFAILGFVGLMLSVVAYNVDRQEAQDTSDQISRLERDMAHRLSVMEVRLASIGDSGTWAGDSEGSHPYTVLGRTYVPLSLAEGYAESGTASWYGRRYHGRLTSSGEPFDMYAFTAAHRTLPVPSLVEIENLSNGRKVLARVNDRGPFEPDHIIEVSWGAARALKFDHLDRAPVTVKAVSAKNVVAAMMHNAKLGAVAGPVDVILDPGNGGADPGAVSTVNGEEIHTKDVNLAFSVALAERLRVDGVSVGLTRATDVSLSQAQRIHLKNSFCGRLFLAVYFAASTHPPAPQVLVSAPTDRVASQPDHSAALSDHRPEVVVARQILRRLNAVAKHPNSEPRPASLRILQESSCPSLVLRVANFADTAFFVSHQAWVDAVAGAITEWLASRP